MKQVRKQSIKTLLPSLLWMGIIAGVLLFMTLPKAIKGMREPENLNNLEYDNLKSANELSGKLVQGTVYFIYDWYCESKNELTGTTSSREYIIDLDDTYYIGMLINGAYRNDADALYEACNEYLNGNGDVDAIYETQFTVSGIISEMPSDSYVYYYEFLDECGLSDDEQKVFLPYYLEVGEDYELTGEEKFGLFIASILLLIAFVRILKWVTGCYQKDIHAYISAGGNKEVAREQVKAFFASTEGQGSIRCTQDLICAQAGAYTMFRKANELLWVYKKQITHKRNFKVTGYSHYLVMSFANGEKYEIYQDNGAMLDVQIERFQKIYPWVICGYSDKLRNLFYHNRNEFKKLCVYALTQKKAQTTQNTPYSATQPGMSKTTDDGKVLDSDVIV